VAPGITVHVEEQKTYIYEGEKKYSVYKKTPKVQNSRLG
jgi:hypothetical protein